MKILILANDDEGLYKFRKELLETLLKDNEVFISLPYGPYVDSMKQMGCHFIDTEFNRKGTNPFKDLKILNTYIKLLKDIKPNYVFTYTIKPNVYGGIACRIMKVSYIVNITGLGSAIENGGLMSKIVLTLYRIGLKKVQKVFFQNENNRDVMLKNHVAKGNYDIIPGSGVNLKDYVLYDYPNNGKIEFVYIGRIMYEKGITQYLDTAEYIHSKYPNTVFHICGSYEEKEYEGRINQLNENGTIVYHGSLRDMSFIYKIVSCTIHPSFYAEGLSNALLESMASGKPIITTNRPGCGELVQDGVNGYLVKQKDSKDLIEKVEKFINLSYETRKQMGLVSRKIVEEKYSRTIVIDKYLKEISK